MKTHVEIKNEVGDIHIEKSAKNPANALWGAVRQYVNKAEKQGVIISSGLVTMTLLNEKDGDEIGPVQVALDTRYFGECIIDVTAAVANEVVRQVRKSVTKKGH